MLVCGDVFVFQLPLLPFFKTSMYLRVLDGEQLSAKAAAGISLRHALDDVLQDVTDKQQFHFACVIFRRGGSVSLSFSFICLFS